MTRHDTTRVHLGWLAVYVALADVAAVALGVGASLLVRVLS